MSTQKLSNVSLDQLRRFLRKSGLEQSVVTKGRGGHEKWIKPGLTRPIVFQSHIEPVPEFIMQQILRTLMVSKSAFFEAIK